MSAKKPKKPRKKKERIAQKQSGGLTPAASTAGRADERPVTVPALAHHQGGAGANPALSVLPADDPGYYLGGEEWTGPLEE